MLPRVRSIVLLNTTALTFVHVFVCGERQISSVPGLSDDLLPVFDGLKSVREKPLGVDVIL